MRQEAENQPAVFHEATPAGFCAAFNGAVAEGSELWTTNLGQFFRSQGMRMPSLGWTMIWQIEP